MSFLTHANEVIFAERFILGLFFFGSGYHKTFVPEVHRRVTGLFNKLGVGNKFVEWSVPLGELFGGLALMIGFLTPIAALGLIIILAGAIYLDVWAEVCAKFPRDWLDWVCKSIYTPEILMVILLTILIFGGDDAYSLDSFIRSRL